MTCAPADTPYPGSGDPSVPFDRVVTAASALRDLINLFTDRDLDTELLDEITTAAERLSVQVALAPRWDRSAVLEAGLRDSDTVEGRRTGFPHRAVAGPANPAANPMPLHFDYEAGLVTSEVTLGPMHGGAPGRAHGGVLAGIFDELAGAAPRLVDTMGVTAQLCINYRNPIPLGQPLSLRAWVDGRDGRKVFVKGDAHRGDDLIADLEGLFVVIDYGAIDTSGAARH